MPLWKSKKGTFSLAFHSVFSLFFSLTHSLTCRALMNIISTIQCDLLYKENGMNEKCEIKRKQNSKVVLLLLPYMLLVDLCRNCIHQTHTRTQSHFPNTHIFRAKLYMNDVLKDESSWIQMMLSRVIQKEFRCNYGNGWSGICMGETQAKKEATFSP